MSQNFELLSQIKTDAEFYEEAPKIDTEQRGAQAVDLTSRHRVSQELLSLAQRLFLPESNTVLREVVFCGVDQESNSSEICMQLGRIVAASSGKRVCLVDANTRSLRLSKMLDPGWRTPITISATAACRQVEANLWLTSIGDSGQPDGNSLTSVDVTQQLAELRSAFSFVLIDAPGVSDGGVAAMLGQIADGTVLVIEADSTRKAAARRAKQAMEAMNVRLLGTVLNNRRFPIPEKLYRKL